MKQIVKRNNSILQNNQQILSSKEESSDIIKYHSFGILGSKETIWIPEMDKSIFLTAVQVSAPLAISVLLSEGNNSFLSLRITEPFTTVSQHFSSAYKLGINNGLMIGTSDEETKCNTFGAINSTQIDYNGRSDFTNINNAIGLANGTVASLNSGVITQTRGRLILGYNMLPLQYDYLEIEKVIVKYYCRIGLVLAVGVSSMIFSWRPDSQATWIQLGELSLSIIGSIDHLTNPVIYDITNDVLSAANPWEVINNLQTSFVGTHTGLGLGNVVQLDAIEIEICMTGKNQITLFGYEA